jgi:hypothetical protein
VRFVTEMSGVPEKSPICRGLKSSLAGSEVLPKATRYAILSACTDIRYDTSKARQQLGWQPALIFGGKVAKNT